MTTGQRIGRLVGLANFVATMAALCVLLLWPKVIGSLVAMLSWPRDEQDACALEPGCAVNIVAGGVFPVWWALGWVAFIATSVLVCANPERWWSSRGKGRFEVFADSTPRWLRVHAGAAVFMCVILVFPGRSSAGVWAPSYLYPAAAALLVMGLATLSLRRARKTHGDAVISKLSGAASLDRHRAAASRAKKKTSRTGKGAAS